MTNIKCFIGVIGSGKDYRAQELVNAKYNKPNVDKYTQVNFADELYIQVGKILDIDLEDRTNREYFKLVYPDARKVLQNYGNLRREEEPEYWVNKWADKVSGMLNENIVCSDVRFLNELEAVLSLDQEVSDMVNGVFQQWNDVEFIFCDYHSDRYEPDNENISERLAQRILKDGYKDGEILTHQYLKRLIENGL